MEADGGEEMWREVEGGTEGGEKIVRRVSSPPVPSLLNGLISSSDFHTQGSGGSP